MLSLIPLAAVAPHPTHTPSHTIGCHLLLAFLPGCFPRKCAETQGWPATQRKQRPRAPLRAFCGPLVTHPSAVPYLSQWEPTHHSGVTGNRTLMLSTQRGCSKHCSEDFKSKTLRSTLRVISILLSLLVCQIYLFTVTFFSYPLFRE